jgi:hypothetical protein
VLERDIAQLAERALDAARDASQAAAPAIQGSAVQGSAETLTHALERASTTLLEAAERFTPARDARVARATGAAREHLASAAERFAQSIRPAPPRHRLRRVILAAALVGGIVALVQSPLRGKLTARLFGATVDEDDAPASITLPSDTSPITVSDVPVEYEGPAPSTTANGGGVASRADSARS